MKNFLLLYKKSIYKHFFLSSKKKPGFSEINSTIIKKFEKTHTRHYHTLAEIETTLKAKRIPYRKKPGGKKSITTIMTLSSQLEEMALFSRRLDTSKSSLFSESIPTRFGVLGGFVRRHIKNFQLYWSGFCITGLEPFP